MLVYVCLILLLLLLLLLLLFELLLKFICYWLCGNMCFMFHVACFFVWEIVVCLLDHYCFRKGPMVFAPEHDRRQAPAKKRRTIDRAD